MENVTIWRAKALPENPRVLAGIRWRQKRGRTPAFDIRLACIFLSQMKLNP
jgi:hypothetical protein